MRRLHQQILTADAKLDLPAVPTAPAGRARRFGVFFAVNLAGACIQLLCLAVSHYLLGFTAPRDDVVSGAGVGMVLATVLRFWGTRTLVFGTVAARGPAGRKRAQATGG